MSTLRSLRAAHAQDPRLRTHSNTARWDQAGFVAERLRAEGLNDTEIGRLLHVTPRTVKHQRARVKP